MTRRKKKKRNPERMKAAIEAMRNKEMGSYKASKVFSLQQTTLQSCVEDRESSSEAIKQNWVGSKFFLVKENMI
jgi:transposase